MDRGKGERTIEATTAGVAAAFNNWLGQQRYVRLLVLEGCPCSGKSTLLHSLPSEWWAIEIDKAVGTDLPTDVAWVEYARRAGVGDDVLTLLGRGERVAVDGGAAGELLADLLMELGPAARRVYVQRYTTDGGHWMDGVDRQGQVERAEDAF